MENTKDKIKKLKDFKPTPNLAVQTKAIKQSEMSGVVVIFDLVASTKLKSKKQFPGWVSDLTHFYKIISNHFSLEKTQWSKFLGDAMMYFFPDPDCNKQTDLSSLGPKRDS